MNLKGNKDIGQLLIKPVFYFETAITLLALNSWVKSTICCLNKYCSSKKVGTGRSRTESYQVQVSSRNFQYKKIGNIHTQFRGKISTSMCMMIWTAEVVGAQSFDSDVEFREGTPLEQSWDIDAVGVGPWCSTNIHNLSAIFWPCCLSPCPAGQWILEGF